MKSLVFTPDNIREVSDHINTLTSKKYCKKLVLSRSDQRPTINTQVLSNENQIAVFSGDNLTQSDTSNSLHASNGLSSDSSIINYTKNYQVSNPQ